MKLAKIGNKLIGDKKKIFITFECGPTHNGFESAKNLIEQSAKAKADAVKFQIFNPEKLFADKKYRINYEVLNTKDKLIKKSKSVYKLFKDRWLDYEQLSELKKISDKKKILFFPTIGDDEGIEFVKKNKCKSVKIASSDLNYHQFLKKVSKLKINIQIDTGNSTIKEIIDAVKIIRKIHNNIIIHYCPTGYPSTLKGANLKQIPYLKNFFKLPIAYSDHFLGENYNHIAIALGACLIEKTITEDKYFNSIEHCMSLETSELKSFVKKIKLTDNMMKNKLYFLNEDAILSRLSNRRSAYALKDLSKGHLLSAQDIIFLRPGYGIPPNRINRVLGQKLKKKIKKNELIKLSHLNK